jgi:hypothetical protein
MQQRISGRSHIMREIPSSLPYAVSVKAGSSTGFAMTKSWRKDGPDVWAKRPPTLLAAGGSACPAAEIAPDKLWWELLGAVERIREAGRLSLGVAQQALAWACASREIRSVGEERRSIDPINSIRRSPSVDLKSEDWHGRLIDNRGFLAPRKGEDSVIFEVYLNHTDLEWWIENRLQWWVGALLGSPDLSEPSRETPIISKPAPGAVIRAATQAPGDQVPASARRCTYRADLATFRARQNPTVLGRMSDANFARKYIDDHERRRAAGESVPELPHKSNRLKRVSVQVNKMRQE